MKRLFALAVTIMLMIAVALPVYADGDLMYFDMVDTFGLSASSWTSTEGRRALLLVAASVDIYNAGYTSGLGSDINLPGSYMGREGALLMVSMPTEDRTKCINAVIDTEYGFGMIEVIRGYFTATTIKKGISASCSSVWGFTESSINQVIDLLLNEIGNDDIGYLAPTKKPTATATPKPAANTESAASSRSNTSYNTVTTGDTSYTAVSGDRTIATNDTSYTLVSDEYTVPDRLLNKQYELGENSKEILEIKQRMQKLGYFREGAELTGNYNSTMQERILMFQKDYGIGQTGEINYVFLKTLYSKEVSERINGK